LLNPGQGDLLANALTIYRLRVLTSEFILSGSQVGGLFPFWCKIQTSRTIWLQTIEEIDAKFAAELFAQFEEAYDTTNNEKLRVRGPFSAGLEDSRRTHSFHFFPFLFSFSFLLYRFSGILSHPCGTGRAEVGCAEIHREASTLPKPFLGAADCPRGGDKLGASLSLQFLWFLGS